MDSDCVSAIVPIKNGSVYISKSIPNILENLRLSDELIVVDDSSSDHSLELVLQAGNSDSRIRVFRNPGVGIVDALNFGITQARFEKIARFDIDDIYRPDRIARQRELLKDSTVAVFCDYNVVDTQEKNLGTIYSPILPFATRLSLRQGQRTPHPGVLFSRSAFFSVGGYLKGEDGIEDLSLWLRLSQVGELISVPDILFSYRIHQNSVTYLRRKQILDMKSEVLKLHPVQKTDIMRYRNQLGEAIIFYKTVSHSYLRIALLVREILLVGPPKERLFSLFCVLKLVPKLNSLAFLRSICSIWLGSKNRRKFRSV